MTTSKLIDCGAGVRLERRVPCRLSDGVTLYSDHYYPPESGVHPTLLMRQPYGRDIASTVVYAHPVWFARQGYNVVIQDVRGRGDSEGDFYPFRHEGRDGSETIAFVRNRPESNGRVGMYGFSYQGMTQLLAAAEEPDGLACISPAMTAHNLYQGWFYQHGALRLASSLGWGLQMLREDARRHSLTEASKALEDAWRNLHQQYLMTPYGAHPAIIAEGLPTYVRDWFEHDQPGSYWTSMDVSTRLDRIKVPALHVSGWYDTYLQGSVDGFLALRSSAGSSFARDHQYLLAGPWIHIPWGERIGPQRMGPAAAFDTDALLLRWFNHWLKDTNEFADEPRVRHFALNESAWHAAEDWPSTPALTLYLHSAGRANASKGDGVLKSLPSRKSSAPDIFVYDPDVPVIAPGGIISSAGPHDQAMTAQGNNVLVYDGEPLDAPLHIFGSPAVSIYCATSAPSCDLVAKLVCVRPNGEARFVCIGVTRSSYLFNISYQADVTHLWTFTLEPTSCVFETGDRIRLEISSSAYPLFDRNSGNGTPARDASSWNWQRSTQLIFHDQEHPSSVTFSVAAQPSSSRP
jgi:putative CocE/NonD family hydrolase